MIPPTPPRALWALLALLLAATALIGLTTTHAALNAHSPSWALILGSVTAVDCLAAAACALRADHRETSQ